MELNNFLYLVWKDPETRRNFIVGKLTKGNKYRFEYCEEYLEAIKSGWRYLEAFPEGNIYESEELFPVFLSRLPDKKRRDISQILKKYNMESFDEFEFLKKSGARLPIDTYEFINPIFSNDEEIQREFFITGVRYHAGCGGEDCQLLSDVNNGDMLVLKEEPENKYDTNAIAIYTQAKKKIGYIPRYYNKAIVNRLNKGTTYSCEVIEIQLRKNCSECIKVKLNMPKV